jgi:hypothetical protein
MLVKYKIQHLIFLNFTTCVKFLIIFIMFFQNSYLRIWECLYLKSILKKFLIFFQINIFIILNCFDVLLLKIIF